MIKKRWFLLLAIIMIVLVGTTGCGGGDKAEKDSVPADNNAIEEPSAAAEKEKIVVAGSGTNLAITRKLADAFMAQNPTIEIEVPPSIGSDGGIKSAGEGAIAIGLVSRTVKDEEKQYGVTYKPYSSVAAVFAAAPDVGVKNLTAKQIVEIYSGKITNWKEVGGKDAAIVVLTREEKDSGRQLFVAKLPGFDKIQESKNNKLQDSDQKMNNSLVQTANCIGWTDLGAIKATNMNVTVLNIDNVEPTQENADSGKYPYLKELAFVYKGELGGAAKKFAEFVLSAEGAKIISDNGYFSIK